jgi:hypothetical protein
MFSTEHMRTDPAYSERLHACGLDTVGRVLARVEGCVAAWSRTTDTLFVSGADGTPGFYVKRYFFPNWTKRLRGTLRGTFFGMHRGQAEYRALNAMRALGIPAVRPVAYGDRRVGHFLAACFLITEEVPGARNLTAFALAVAAGRQTLSPAQRRALLAALAEQLAALHATGCSHGNLFWRNLLVRHGPDSRPEFFFLDAQPLRSWQRLGRNSHWWLRELAQVTVSATPFTTRTERLRFMHYYLGGAPLTPQLKNQLRQIEHQAQSWRRHELRRIRMTRLFDEWNRQLLAESGASRGRETALVGVELMP